MTTTTLHVNGPSDILAILPYELGYHPRDSLVVVGLRGGRLGLRARVDLPPPEHADETVATLVPPIMDSGAEQVLLIGYERTIGDSMPMLEAMEDVCVEAGLEVGARMVVRDGRWFDVDCGNVRCCPPEGRPLPAPEDVPAVAEFVAMEKHPVADRTELARALRPAHPLLAGAVDHAAARWLERRMGSMDQTSARGDDETVELEAWGRLLDVSDDATPVPDLGAEDLSRLAVSLLDVELRDGLIAWLCPGTLGLDRVAPDLARQLRATLPAPSEGEGLADAAARQRVEARLMELCRCLSPDWAVAPLTLLASFTWWRGDGTLTRLALEQALDTDPTYRLALLLLRMVDLSIRPERMEA